jgi:hypothetical protein
MNAPIIIAPVRKSVRVKAPVARAFVFAFSATLRCGEPVQPQL